MLAKLAFLVLVIAATGAGLLTVRQQRLEAVHEMAEALDRAAVLEREVWRLRVEAARLTSPQYAQELLAVLGETKPVVARRSPPAQERFALEPVVQPGDAL